MMTELLVTELGLDDLPETAVSHAYETWLTWCDGSSMPPWDRVDLVAISSLLLPQTTVVGVARDPLNFIYRFWGTGLVKVHGEEMTGRSVNELKPVEVSDVSKAGFRAVVERKSPTLAIHQYRDEGHHGPTYDGPVQKSQLIN